MMKRENYYKYGIRIIVIFVQEQWIKMSDKHYREDKLWAYMDGDLKADEQSAIQHHLSYCATCQELMSELKSFDNELAQTVVESPSMRFSKNVMELIEEEVTSVYSPIIPPFWQKLIATGFGTLVVSLLFLPTFLPANSNIPFMEDINNTTDWLVGATSIFQNPIVLMVVGGVAAFWILFATDKFFLSKKLR